MWSYRTGFWVLVFLIVIGAVWNLNRPQGAQDSGTRSSKVVFVTGGPGQFWQTTVAGAKSAAKEHGVELEVNIPSKAESLDEQIQILAAIDPKAIGGLAISPVDAEQQTRLINRLAADTNVLTFDSDAPLSSRHGYVGTSNYGAGRLCARLVHEAIPQGGKVAIVMANQTKANLLDRKSGLDDHLNRLLAGESPEGRGEYTVVDYLVDDGDNEKCAQLVRKTVEDNPDLNCFVGLNARHGPVFLQVLEGLGKLGDIKLVTFDDDEETLEGVEAGHIHATIAQDAYRFGYEAVRILASRISGAQDGGAVAVVGRGEWNVPAEAIREDNVEEHRERLRARRESPEPKEQAASPS